MKVAGINRWIFKAYNFATGLWNKKAQRMALLTEAVQLRVKWQKKEWN